MVHHSDRRELDLIYCGLIAAIETGLFRLGECFTESTPSVCNRLPLSGRHRGTRYGFALGYQEAGTLNPGLSGYSNNIDQLIYGYRRIHERVFRYNLLDIVSSVLFDF